jgi:hypothetical protein
VSASRPNLVSALALAALCAFNPSGLRAAPFAPGNLVVVRSAPSGGAFASRIVLDEYTTAAGQAAPVQSILLPHMATDPIRLTQTGNATTEGSLSRSADGRYLTLVGYDAPSSTPNVPTTSFARVIGRVDQSGNVAYSTTGDYSAQGVNSAASADGGQVWVGNDTGVRSFAFGGASGTAVAGDTTRVLHVFDGQLYGSQAGTIFRTNDPLPSGTSGITALPGVSTNSAMGFVLLDRDASVAGVDTLYVADQNGGLRKFSFDGSTWTARGVVSGNITGLAGAVNGSSADLYVTTGLGTGGPSPELRRLTDAAAFNADISGAYVTLATAPANQAFRSVSFTPVPEPGALLLAGVAAAGFAGLTIRRRPRRQAARYSLAPEPARW